MKRPPGLWILLSAGVLWLCVQNVNSVRATALIFGKGSTTSTTTEASVEETATNTEPSSEVSNVTKPTLTGNPQIDYVWDPNLPKELNGYNLSEYPFYERVPEDIDFKCDGLHDGFYASVPHKCQVYHHCLFGTRYDFLCANYTAFDQKTFICHFVSEVDCVNSKKFWHRNDALYQAATTTTLKPLVIHTTAAEGLAATPLSLPSAPGAHRPTGGARRRPYRRRRPQYEYYDDEYYDDYYEERPRSRRKRPRPRPRPVYDDEYDEEYDEDRYERRNSRRPTYRRRTKDRRKQEYEDDEVVDDRFEDEDFKNAGSRRNNEDRKKSNQDSREETSTEKKSEKRRPSSEEHQRKPFQPMHSSRKGSRKPISEEYEDETVEDTRPKKKEERKSSGKPTDDGNRVIIKPVSGTIYDRPRLAPRIKLPVPKNEADKYAYKPIQAPSTQAPSAAADEEYYDEYEDEEPVVKSKPNRKPADKTSEEEKESRKQVTAASRSRYTAKKPKEEERPRGRPSFSRGNNRKRPVEYEDEYEEEERNTKHHKTVEREEDEPRSRKERRPSGKPDKEPSTTSTTTTTTTTSTTTTTTTTTTPAPVPYREKPDPIVRIVKRPFLPSRGGNPYSPRGLQPVGAKAEKKQEPIVEEEDYPLSEEMETKEGRRQYVKASTESKEHQDASTERPFKPSPALIKIPMRQKFVTTALAQENYTPTAQSEIRTNYKTKEYNGPRTTQKPKLADTDPLDDYDVTLNDALNPTLPNLPVRGFPTGFSAAHDYTFSSFQRPRYVVDPVLTQASTDYVYQAKAPVRQRYEIAPQSGGYRGRTAPQTQAYYSSF